MYVRLANPDDPLCYTQDCVPGLSKLCAQEGRFCTVVNMGWEEEELGTGRVGRGGRI